MSGAPEAAITEDRRSEGARGSSRSFAASSLRDPQRAGRSTRRRTEPRKKTRWNARTLGFTIALAALVAGSRFFLYGLPNVKLTYFVVFVAGLAFGPAVGALAGALGMVASDVMLSAFDPVLVVNSSAMAALGALGGLLRRAVDFGQRGEGAGAAGRSRARDGRGFVAVTLAALAGVLGTVVFSVLADTLDWALFAHAGRAAWEARVLSGLAFNAIPAAFNGVVFAIATAPTLRALRKAGLSAPA
ncbi:MAG: hypothetical protein ACYDCK_09670 [Thermoplasmatota archaeon]